MTNISDILAGKAGSRRKSRGRPTSIESQRDPLGRQSSTSSLGANTSYDGDGEERTYDCDICGKQFSHNDRLRRHRKIHTTEKPYKCDICGKGFKEKCNLKHHRYIHTGMHGFSFIHSLALFTSKIMFWTGFVYVREIFFFFSRSENY